MAKIRVHELAKELDIPSKELVKIIQDFGIYVKNHMSTLEDQQAEWLKKRLGKSKEAEERKEGLGKEAKPPEKKEETPSVKPAPIQQPKSETAVKKPEPTRTWEKPQPTERRGEERRGPAFEPRGTSRPAPEAGSRPAKGPSERDFRPREGAKPGQRGPFPEQGRRPFEGGRKPPFREPSGEGMRRQTPFGPPRTEPKAAPERDAKDRKKTWDRVPPPEAPVPQRLKEGKGRVFFQGPKEEPDTWDRLLEKEEKELPQKVWNRAARRKSVKEERKETTPEVITVGERISVRELAEKLMKSPAEVIKRLMLLNINVSLNQEIDFEIAELVASDFSVQVEREKSKEELILEEIVDDEASLKPRPPVVTVMGHVDHGKTSLLDAIRETNVVSREAGGITQHIGAYQVEINGEKITFIDTPGHEAFTAMRARGAQVTDIAVLVVAADDGVMPQTIEAINHAKAAEVPIMVAINKIDKPNSNPDRVKQQLAELGLVPEEWGGDTIMVPVSAKTKQGIEQLLEMILLLAEMRELKANPDRPAEGVVIESQLDKGRGPVATVLVQKGTLRVGDSLICGMTYGKVRAMINDKGERVNEAGPSVPVEVLGLADVPMAGDRIRVVDDRVARQVSELRLSEKKREEQAKTSKVTLDDLFRHISEGEVKELNLIIKGDVQGSVEALTQSLVRLSTDEIKVNVIHAGVGAVTESDVMLASASNAIIIGFNVRPDIKARKYAEDEKIDVRLYRVIYEVIDDIKKAMSGLLEPEYVERFQGRAEVRATFKVPKVGLVAGCYVLEGKITRTSNVRLLRNGVIVFEGKIGSLKRFKDDVKEVVETYECGIGIEGFNDIKEGDIIEAYTMEAVPRQL